MTLPTAARAPFAARVLIALLCACLAPATLAAPMTVTPAMGGASAVISVKVTGLSPSTNYALEFAGNPITQLGTLTSNISGQISATVALPSLPIGSGKLRLKTTVLGGSVVAFTAFTVLRPVTFTPQVATIHAGQSLRYTAGNLVNGSLTILYDGIEVAGPIAVSTGSYDGKFVVPTDRPASLPAAVPVRLVNKVGKHIVSDLDTTLTVQPGLSRPFQVSIAQPPPPQAKRGKRFNVTGQIDVAANEVAPELVSLWFTGTNGEVFPLGAAQPTPSGNQWQYEIAGTSPGSLAMTAGYRVDGETSLYTPTTSPVGMPIGMRDAPLQAQIDELADDRWRIRVRVRTPDGDPIVGAIVQFDGAPVAGDAIVGSLDGYAGQAVQESQLTERLATDAFGCPVTLGRQVTDANGWAEFEFENDELWRAAIPLVIPGNGDNIVIPAVMRMAVNAAAQGYGFQFTSGPDAFDFLPHVYRVQFEGLDADDTNPADDEIAFIDDYQNVEVLRGGRDVTFPLTLPPIEPKVGLYDTAIVPWVASTRNVIVLNNQQGFTRSILTFGPVNSQRGMESPIVVSETPGQPYPTEITVRTDPAVSGVVTSARLFLDANRDGTSEHVGNFTPSNEPLDCSLDGLDQSLTWRASIAPLGVKQQAAGTIKGHAEFIGPPSSGRSTQRIEIVVRETDVSWLLDTGKYSDQRVNIGGGGQYLGIHAIEDTADADVQLDDDPGYDIGRLENRTDNTRMIDLFFDRAGNQTASVPLAGGHREAGRTGAPTLIEPALDAQYGPEILTLLDQSFPLFYYVWGVPVLAGIEVGADFSILAEIETRSKFSLSANKKPTVELTTTPSLDLGLNFYLDIDVLFDLVDGGVDLDAIFALEMPISVQTGRNPETIVSECFTASLIFSWHFEVFCLPLDFVCDAINDIEGAEVLLNESTGSGCGNNLQSPLADAKGAGRASARIQPRHGALAYSASGAGFLAFTRDDSNGSAPPVLVVRPVDGGDFGRIPDETVLSSAPGIRSVDIEFYLDNRAMIVWAESDRDYPTLAALQPHERLARQRLMYSHFDGETWSAKTVLTNASGGEGGVDLAACPISHGAACPGGGELFAVWTRDMAGDIRAHQTRVYSSRYDPARGWTTPMPVDANAVLDSAPSAAYAGSERVVAFVHSTSGVFGDTDSRRIAYRFLGSGANAVQVPAGLPGGVAWPSIVGFADGRFSIAHTHANDPRAFVGNTQRVALAHATGCTAGACAIQAQAITDGQGRPIYGERPKALLDESDNLTVVLRGMGFGTGSNGSNTGPDDPIGMALHTGELISFVASPGQDVVAPISLSSDGAGHFAPNAAYDPVMGQAVALSTRGTVIPQALRSKYLDTGAKPAPARSKGVVADPGLMVFSAEQGVDFAIEEIAVQPARLVAGSTVAVGVRVRNIGAAYTVASPPFRMLLSWDSPYTAGGTYAAFRNIAPLAPGESHVLSGNLVVPAGYSPDQNHRLYARIFRNNNPAVDVNSGNDVRFASFGGMPMPFGLNASAIPGTTLAQLNWDPIDDPDGLIAGYRVWCHDGNGKWRHLGSSFELGFLDLAAPVGKTRHYRVTSYSRNAIESPPSSEAVATVVLGDQVLIDGFE